MGDPAEIQSFLEAFFDPVPHNLWTLLWTRQDKQSHWCQVGDGAESIAQKALGLSEHNDVYISTSFAASKGGFYRRIKADESAGLAAFWADVDIAEPDVHKKYNLPSSEQQAREIIEATGVAPSALIHSGHGLQAWWFFTEFLAFETSEDRSEGALLARAWHETVAVRASERQCTIDSVHDLARVMRLPGTSNFKAEQIIPTRTLGLVPHRRYGSTDFEDHLVDQSFLRELGISAERTYQVDTGGLHLDPNAQIPHEKFEVLAENDEKFQRTWDRKRRDFADQSPSSYDLSLAVCAASVGWTDQEIIDLLISHRRRHKDDLKLRMDYYSRTISKARDTVGREQVTENMDAVQDKLDEARKTGDDDEVKRARNEAADVIAQQLTLDAHHFVRQNSVPPVYYAETSLGRIQLGTASDLLSWAKTRGAIFAASQVLIPRFKPAQWDQICTTIADIAIEEDVGVESTDYGQTYLWVSEYLMAHPPFTVEKRDDAGVSEEPFIDADGLVVIFSSAFAKWLWVHQNQRIPAREIARLLRIFKAVPEKLNVQMQDRRTTKSVWRLHLPGEFDA